MENSQKEYAPKRIEHLLNAKKDMLDSKEQLMLILAFIAYKDATIPKNMQDPAKVCEHIKTVLSNVKPVQEIVWGPAIGGMEKKPDKNSSPQKYLYRFLANSAMCVKLVSKSKLLPCIPQNDDLPISSLLSRSLLKFETLSDSTARLEYFNRPLMYIVKDSTGMSRPEYTVVIRGPNPNSLSTLKEEYDISTPVEWKPEAKFGGNMNIVVSPATQACISSGTHKYMKDYLALSPGRDFCGANQNIVDFLKDEICKDKGITINFTGHGMGGLLATTMALWFQEELESEGYTSKDGVDIRAYSFGAPAPGNEEFAQHSHKVLGDKCTIYTNRLDITVYQWIGRDIKDKVLYLYSDVEIAPDPLVIEYLSVITKTMHADWYAKLKNEKHIFSVLKSARDYIEEAAYQHLFPYILAVERRSQTEEVWSDIKSITEALYYSWSVFYFFL